MNKIVLPRHLIDIFVSMGGDQKFLEYVIEQTLKTPKDDEESTASYRKFTSAWRSKLKAVERHARNMAVDMDFLNKEITEEWFFSSEAIEAVKNIETLARRRHDELLLKRKRGGQLTHIRQIFFISSVLPYIKFKEIPFGKGGKSNYETTLWMWLYECCYWFSDTNEKDALNETSPIESLQSWWQQALNSKKPMIKTFLSGVGSYIWWSRKLHEIDEVKKGDRFQIILELPFTEEEHHYIQVAKKILRPLQRIPWPWEPRQLHVPIDLRGCIGFN